MISGYVRLGLFIQVTSGYVGLWHVISSYVKLCQVRTG